jgi:hypothetical protein
MYQVIKRENDFGIERGTNTKVCANTRERERDREREREREGD